MSIQKFRRAQAVSPSATSSTSRRSNSSQSPARASSPNSPKVTALKQAQMARAASKASKAKAAQEAAKAISTASEAKVKGEASKKEAAATLKQASLSDDATAATACQTVRQMFEEADKNHNSILEANELAILMASMHRRVSVARKGNAAMARDGTKAILAQIEMLDTTRQGGLNFGQFCKVLNMEPWSALLPADISCQLLSTAAQVVGTPEEVDVVRKAARASSPSSPKVTALKQAQMARAASKASKAKAAQEAAKAISTASEAKVKGEASKKEAAATLKQASLSDDATAATACQTVRQMFEEADKNHNSILEANELAILMASMHRRVSVARKGNAAMARDGTKAILAQIEMLDTTRQGGLNFGQFCKVLNMEPWSALLPADISCQLLSTAAQAEEGDIKATSKPASYDWTDLTAPQLTQYLHQLFTIGDTNGDGVLQPKEFKKLMKLSGLNFPKEVIAKVCVQEKCMW